RGPVRDIPHRADLPRFGRVDLAAVGVHRIPGRRAGALILRTAGNLRFVPVPAPTTEELKRLVQRIAERIGRSLERSGLITRDIENAYPDRMDRAGAARRQEPTG